MVFANLSLPRPLSLSLLRTFLKLQAWLLRHETLKSQHPCRITFHVIFCPRSETRKSFGSLRTSGGASTSQKWLRVRREEGGEKKSKKKKEIPLRTWFLSFHFSALIYYYYYIFYFYYFIFKYSFTWTWFESIMTLMRKQLLDGSEPFGLPQFQYYFNLIDARTINRSNFNIDVPNKF